MKRVKWVVGTALVLGVQYSQAQSAVTLYGILDEGITHVSNVGGASVTRADSGVIVGERLGFRGVEDLGGGLRSVFTLENGFTSSNGAFSQGGLLFGRQAYVGIGSKSALLTLGRQYDASCDILSVYGIGTYFGGFPGLHKGDIDRVGGERNNNAVKLTSTPLSGLTGVLMYGFGNQPGSVSQNQQVSAGLRYSTGPFSVGAAYTRVRNAVVDIYSTFGIATFDNVSLAPHGTTPASSLQTSKLATWGVGASYQLGAALLKAIYTATYLDDAYVGSGTQHDSLAIRVGEASVQYYFTPFLSAGLAYAYTSLSNEMHFGQVTAGVDYALSKRTDVYLLAVEQRATGSGAVATITTITNSSSKNQNFVRLGVRHIF